VILAKEYVPSMETKAKKVVVSWTKYGTKPIITRLSLIKTFDKQHPGFPSCLLMRDRWVVERSDDLAGTSFGHQVDSGPSSCKTRVVKREKRPCNPSSFVVHVDRHVASSSTCFAVL
jgi:hypothetical protein